MSEKNTYIVYDKASGKVVDVVYEGVICCGNTYSFANKKYDTMWTSKQDYKKLKFRGKK